MAAKTTLATALIPRDSFAFSETGQHWTQVTLPEWARRVVISPQSNAIKVRVSSAHGFAAEGQAYTSDVLQGAESVAAGAKYAVPVTAGRGNKPQCTVWVYAPTNPTVIEVACEESEVG